MTSQRLIDGIVPDRVETPDNADDIAELIRQQNAAGGWLLPVGGGTALNGADPVDEIPLALDLSAVDGILDYEPADLTVSVAAGTRWRTLQERLGQEGQTLPLDVPFPGLATVGGVVATGYAGPRRLRDGSLKDLLLGASFVRGDGLAAKAGGMVVKNVSGFEIPRLLHGSWGSLAVITSVNLKVMPAHEFELTLTSDELDFLDAAQRLLDLTRQRSAIAAAVVDGDLQRGVASVRLTGRERPTRTLAEDIRDEGSIRWSRSLEVPAESAAYWQTREDELATNDPDRVSIEIGSQPADAIATLRALRTALPATWNVKVRASPGTGAVAIAFDADTCSLETWRRVWREHGLDRTARFVVNHAPRAWRAAGDVWSIPAGPRTLMQSLKTIFDPHDTLNRGRLWTAAAEACA